MTNQSSVIPEELQSYGSLKFEAMANLIRTPPVNPCT